MPRDFFGAESEVAPQEGTSKKLSENDRAGLWGILLSLAGAFQIGYEIKGVSLGFFIVLFTVGVGLFLSFLASYICNELSKK